MQTIALVEAYDHGEVLYVLCELLLENREVKLRVFSQQYIREHAPASIRAASRMSWFSWEGEEREAFFKSQEARMNECSLIVWITAMPPYGWMLRRNWKAPMVLIVHNRYTWFAPLVHFGTPGGGLSEAARDGIRLLRWLFFHRRGQRRLLRAVRAVAFGSRAILEEAIRENHLPASGKAFWAPFAYMKHRPCMSATLSETIQIAIPGTVTDNGRDYDTVADALALALPRIRRPVQLTLLGKAGPAAGVQALLQMESPAFRLILYPEWAPQREYEARLLEADFLILPFQAWHKVGFVREYWGVSCCSGAVSDMVCYGLPALCSRAYALEPELEAWVERYADSWELSELLTAWVNESLYLEKKKALHTYEGYFRKEQAAALLLQQLTG